MSEPEKFIDRWSRRKREAADESAPIEPKEAAATPPSAEANVPAADASFDPASLPPIESISAESDISVFLKAGVPPELARAALRRAWSADPAIRNFIGLVENGWDFNDPNGIPGFGPIQPGDVARLLAQAIGAPAPEPAAPQKVALAEDKQSASPARVGETKQQLPQDQPTSKQEPVTPEKDFVQRNDVDAALQNNSGDEKKFPPARLRGHGGALPK